jgi:hypothetical protein
MDRVRVTELNWADEPLGTVEFPNKSLILRHGIGSGLAKDPDEPNIVWAVADRGPNLELETAVEEYGWRAPGSCADQPDAKIMPRLDMGPYIAKLRVAESAVELVETIRLHAPAGEPTPGVPIPERGHAQCEPAYDLNGNPLDPDASGMDTEGIAVLADGSFWLSEEYGPSLIEVDRSGRVKLRLLPKGSALAGAPGVIDSLPALASRRHLNRGFEAVTVVPSQDRLFIAFQSPLAHPDSEAFKQGRHVRLWELDRAGAVLGQYLYPFDPPDSFERDAAKKKLAWKDLKICELTAVAERTLLVLERSLETCKIYRVQADERRRIPAEHLDIDTRPTVEEMSGAGGDFPLPTLDKTPLFSSDQHPEVGADMEGMTLLSERSLLIVSDNDFGVLDKKTRFYRLEFADALAG